MGDLREFSKQISVFSLVVWFSLSLLSFGFELVGLYTVGTNSKLYVYNIAWGIMGFSVWAFHFIP